MRNKKGYHIIHPIPNEERFSSYYCYYLFWVAVGYYLWKKILTITGYRFHPTDFELLHYYLLNKNLGRDSLVQAIAELEDICGLEPWQLPGHSNIQSGDHVWYFFYRPSFKYQNGSRINRTTNEGYWKPTGKPRVIMARDQDIEIGKKRTLVFHKGRVNDNIKMKTGWIMHEYQLTATLPNQATFVLCKLKRKFGKAEVSCIEEGQPSHYLPPNLGNYIANNANQAEAARCLTANSDPNEMLTQLEALNDHEELEHQSIEWWNSYVGGGFPKHDGSGDFGTHGAENAIPNHHLLTEITMGQEVLQDQSGTNEQDISNLGDLGPGDERSNQHKLVMDDDGCNMPSNSENDTAEDSVKMDLSTFAGPSTDEEVFAGLEALPEAQGNRIGQMIDDWILDEGIRNAFDNQCSREEQNPTPITGGCNLSFAPDALNIPRKRSRTDYCYEGFGFDTNQ
ncbi:hypothetical protein ES332_A11G115900v1 [Gossypium tomentosum]|uniref:NAC domain-containing protein n=1 Tax=Gossypium tomentosum TaxID=34277 RepID=A0A5D2NCE2_GOSTO|nr:hypothetical protein ES332_A11G115900v1 [Gossypium tomentosum]